MLVGIELVLAISVLGALQAHASISEQHIGVTEQAA
jgi:hypothetical protein